MVHNETQEGSTGLPEAEGGESLASATAQFSREAAETSDPLPHSLLAGQSRAVDCAAGASAALKKAAQRVAAALRNGGRLVDMGAGSWGLLAMQDGPELPGTFGVGRDRLCFVTPNGERPRRARFWLIAAEISARFWRAFGRESKAQHERGHEARPIRRLR